MLNDIFSADMTVSTDQMPCGAPKPCTGHLLWPRGLTDKASDFESEDCGFESHRGRVLHIPLECC